jgi:membrane-associated phospholipid phosphatase
MTGAGSAGQAWWRYVLLRGAQIPPERRKLFWPVKGWITVAAVVAVLVVATVSMLLVDAFAIGRAHQLPKWVPATFEWISMLGNSGWFLWSAGILFIFLAASPRSGLTPVAQRVAAALMVRVSFLFLAVGLPALFTTVIKRFIGRGRPYVWHDPDPFDFTPFVWASDYSSLPSGHATNAFAAAIAIGALWPSMRLPMWIFAVVIALSRIIVLAHFPSDVIIGAAVGIAGALLVRGWFASRRLAFTVDSDGIIHRLPGPSWRRIKAVAGELLGP